MHFGALRNTGGGGEESAVEAQNQKFAASQSLHPKNNPVFASMLLAVFPLCCLNYILPGWYHYVNISSSHGPTYHLWREKLNEKTALLHCSLLRCDTQCNQNINHLPKVKFYCRMINTDRNCFEESITSSKCKWWHKERLLCDMFNWWLDVCVVESVDPAP